MASMLRFSQWLMIPASNAAAHATPPSWKANERLGKRIGTPPKTSDRHVPSSAAPNRVVVVDRVVTDGVDPATGPTVAFVGARDDAPEHHRLEPEVADRVI